MSSCQSSHAMPVTSSSPSSAPSPESLAHQVSYSESFLYANQPIWAPTHSAAPGMTLPRSMPSLGAGFDSSSDLSFLDHTPPVFSYDNMQASTSQVSWDTPSSSSYDRRISDAGRSSPMIKHEQDQDNDNDHDDNLLVPLEDKRRRKRPGRYVNANPEVLARRRERNRKSQRDYRQRKEQRILELEEQLREAQKREETISQAYSNLQAEHSRLLREKTLSPSSVSIGSPSFTDEPLPSLDFESQPL